jgi:hypothetical protein
VKRPKVSLPHTRLSLVQFFKTLDMLGIYVVAKCVVGAEASSEQGYAGPSG